MSEERRQIGDKNEEARPMFEFGVESVPAEACCFDHAEVTFGDNGEAAKTAPVSMMARTGQPIDHWYWGLCVHDMSGCRPQKARLVIDYLHNDEEILGYLNRFEPSNDGLKTSGALTPFEPLDRASEVLMKARAGVPYEASIDFNGPGLKLEWLDEDVESQVNGFTFKGPGVIFRQWPLCGVAILPHGADPNTRTEFKGKRRAPVPVTVFRADSAIAPTGVIGATAGKEGTMAEEKTAEAPTSGAVDATQEAEAAAQQAAAVEAQKAEAEAKAQADAEAAVQAEKVAAEQAVAVEAEKKPAEAKAAAEAEAAKKLADEAAAVEAQTQATKPEQPEKVSADGKTAVADPPGKKFLDAFGEKGGVYFAKGLSFADAEAEHRQFLAGEVKRLEAEVADLGAKLAKLEGRGTDPVSFGGKTGHRILSGDEASDAYMARLKAEREERERNAR